MTVLLAQSGLRRAPRAALPVIRTYTKLGPASGGITPSDGLNAFARQAQSTKTRVFGLDFRREQSVAVWVSA